MPMFACTIGHAGLDQPPGQQQRLAERVPAVAVADGRRLAVEPERPGHPAGGEQLERPVAGARGTPGRRRRGSRLLQQVAARRHAGRVGARRQARTASMRKVGRVRVLRDEQRVVRRPEEPGVLARPGERPLDQRVRQRDARREPSRRGRTVVERPRRSTASRGATARCPGRDPRWTGIAAPVSSRCVPGRWPFSPCDSDRTSAQCCIRAASRGRCSQTWMPGTARVDRLELAADLGRRVRLHVERVDVAHPAGEQHQDDRLRPLGGPAGGVRPAGEQTRQGESECTARTNLKKRTAWRMGHEHVASPAEAGRGTRQVEKSYSRNRRDATLAARPLSWCDHAMNAFGIGAGRLLAAERRRMVARGASCLPPNGEVTHVNPGQHVRFPTDRVFAG